MIHHRAYLCALTGLSRSIRRAALVAVLVAVATPLAAQVNTFDLSGVVKDEQAGVLPGVSVTMRNEATGFTRTVVSDATGHFYFASLPPRVPGS